MATLPEAEEAQPAAEPARLLLLGPTRAGKTSIKKVIFNKLAPHETLWLENTKEVSKREISNSAFVQFEILDFPGKLDLDQALPFVERCGAVIFVLDAQEPNHRAEVRKICAIAQAIQKGQEDLF